MGFADLFCAASMPVLKVLIVTALGSFLALDSIDILGQSTRKQINNVSLIKYLSFGLWYICLTKLGPLWTDCVLCVQSGTCRQQPGKYNHIRKHHLIVNNLFIFPWFKFNVLCSIYNKKVLENYRWFMPINILITFIIGTALGWVLVIIAKPPQHLKGLVLGSCAAGNLYPIHKHKLNPRR